MAREELRFEYDCHFCGEHVEMGTGDIIEFIGTRYGTTDEENLSSFFNPHSKKYNLCPQCARDEGFDVDDFMGVPKI